MTNERPPIRVGTAERTAALKALDEHLAAGRLDVDEYGERSARAANAVTAPELAALFDDLPAPHPPLPSGVPPAPPPVPRAPDRPSLPVPLLVALSAPFLLLALFVGARTGTLVLLVPVLLALPLLSAHRRRRDR